MTDTNGEVFIDGLFNGALNTIPPVNSREVRYKIFKTDQERTYDLSGIQTVHMNQPVTMSIYSRHCGNYSCEPGENFSNCSTDCAPYCGDNFCSPRFDLASGSESICSQDCGTCGDHFCISPETVAGCPQDCGIRCGDYICSAPTETVSNCPSDCQRCGDLICTPPLETSTSCPSDCFVCGDRVCAAPQENLSNCLIDCARCGDGVCSTPVENSTNCSDCRISTTKTPVAY